MGNWNCTSGARKKTKDQGNDRGQAKNVTDDEEERSSAEDVTYTTVDHAGHSSKTPAATFRDSRDDCDYAIVNIPSQQNSRPETKTSTADDSGDDEYVQMQ